MSESIKVSIQVDGEAARVLSDFTKKSELADRSLKKMGDTGKSTFNDISVGIGKSVGVFDIFAGNLSANLVVGAFNLMKDAAGALFQTLLVDGVKAAAEEEAALNSLNVALALSGQYSEESSRKLQAFAEGIQATTTVSDDAVLANLSLLSSLTRLDTDGLQRAQTAAINLSAALGKDLGTATEIVAKASNGTFTALNKLGISIEKGRNEAETFENVMSSLETRFGGTAQAQVGTYTGSLGQLQNTFSDLQETIGNTIVQNPVVIAVFQELARIFTITKGEINGNLLALKELVGKGIIIAIDAAIIATATFDTLARSVQFLHGITVGIRTPLIGIAAAYTLFTEGAKAAGEQLKKTYGDALENVQAFGAKGDGALRAITDNLANLKGAAEASFGKIGENAVSSASKLKGTVFATNELTEAEKKRAEELGKFALKLAETASDETAQNDAKLSNLRAYLDQSYILESEADSLKFEEKLALEQNYYIQKNEAIDAHLLAEQTKVDEALALKQISQEQHDLAILQLKKNADARLTASATEFATKEKAIIEKKKKYEELTQKEKVANLQSTFNQIATLSNSSNKTLAAIGKTAAIANATIDGYAAVQKALASAPPPFNFALAGLVGVATAANVSKIAGVNFEQGGIVPGSSFTGDRVSANVNSGEMILNRQQQSTLFNVANGAGSGGSGIINSLVEEVRALKGLMNQPLIVNIEGREIFNVTRNQLASGRSF